MVHRAAPHPLLAVTLLAVPLLALLAAPAGATPVSYGTGLSSPGVTVAFDGLADGTEIGQAYAGLGVGFTGLVASSRFGDTLAPSTAPAAANFTDDRVNAAFAISFSTVVKDAVFFLFTDGYGTTITSTLRGQVVETVTAGQYATSGADYFGFTDSAFDGLLVSVSRTGTAVIDNVQFTAAEAAQPIPEPGTGGMMLAGLAGLVGLGARRRG